MPDAIDIRPNARKHTHLNLTSMLIKAWDHKRVDAQFLVVVQGAVLKAMQHKNAHFLRAYMTIRRN
ncbi:MAG: hypothetical protein EOQ69_28695 [Mesorhizobium sp.]|nr:MAG: hypothetical protein EOQ69_28695 [Mesorhizobium sp.]